MTRNSHIPSESWSSFTVVTSTHETVIELSDGKIYIINIWSLLTVEKLTIKENQKLKIWHTHKST